MDSRLIFLLVTLCSVTHAEHGDSDHVGFLMYFPANLRAGSTALGHVETDTTENVTVELNFIHSSQDRHFGARKSISGGSGSIEIEVPDTHYWSGRLNFTLVVDSTGEQSFASQDRVYIYQEEQKATFIETDKPIYKPGQEVKFRLVTIDSQFKPDTSSICKIQVESPQGIRLMQWRSVERPQGLVDLSFQLILEPPLGEYAIRAHIDGEWIVQPFKVDEYVLPKFEITVNAPGYLLIDAEGYSFQVCAKYTYGQPVRGTVQGKVGTQERHYQYRYYPRPAPAIRLGEEEEEPELGNAIAYDGELDKDGCLDVTLDVTGLELNSYDNAYWRTKIGVYATVTEASSGNEFSKTVSVTNMEANPMNIVFESPDVFKPSLPYQGRIKVTYPNTKPAVGETVRINAEVEGASVYKEEFTVGDQGIVLFEIPFATKNQSISLNVHALYSDQEATTPAPSVGPPRNYSRPTGYQIYQARAYLSLDPAYSPTGRYIQIVPVYDALNAGETAQIRVLYTSNDTSVAAGFKFLFMARNRLVDAGAEQVGVSRRRRTAGNGETVCQQHLREAKEKGEPEAFLPDCDEFGVFIPRQCHNVTNQCWCVTPEGQEVEGTRRSGEPLPECPEEETPIELPFGQIGSPDLFNQCPEGSRFADGVKKCVRIVEDASDETECQRQAKEASEKGLLGAVVPTCTEEGMFEAQQCHGSTGHCWCVDMETGEEVPDSRSGPTEERIECEVPPVLEETECQRQVRESVEKGPRLGAFSPECDQEGNFMPQQCHGSTGHCYCVETETGVEIEGTRTRPGEDKVPCSEPTEPPTTVPTVKIVRITAPPIEHVDPLELQEATFTVEIVPSMSPEAQLLVYYTSPEGEVVADSINVKVNEAFENEVVVDFASDEVKPGGETTMTVSAEPGSLCSVGIVDKSVYVLGGENKMTPQKLFSAFDLSVRRSWYGTNYCPGGYWYRKKRSIAPYYPYPRDVRYVDSVKAFSDAGLLTLTNLDINVAPCQHEELIFRKFDSPAASGEGIAESGRGAEEKEDGRNIRSYFPETWLWTLAAVSETSAEIALDVPHSITDWIANGFCTSVEKGVGIAPPVTLRAFQPFFLSMSLPYAIIREEKTPIKATVFNYLDLCLVVRVTLTDSEEFILSGEDSFTVGVPAGEATTVTFKLAASSVGDIPIQVSAESIDDEDSLCDSEAVSGKSGTRDAVLRTLKVKPEGEEETIAESDYVCLDGGDDGYERTITIDVPEQHVPDTPKGEVTVTGDLVGKTLSNVEDLIRMPYGCGEQNILSMVPNIVALQYLRSINETTPEIESEAKKFILAGYQRELNYRRNDSSYSAFGNNNPSGSTFLTAFVVRTYAHANKFVDIDEDDLSVTIDWLRSIQEKDGTFRTVGYLAHKAMKGGVNNNVTLAAYVVSTFLEAGYTVEDRTVSRAFDYLNSQLSSLEDNYAMALLAYAYALAHMDQFSVVYAKLEESVIDAEGTWHWESNRAGLPEYTNYYQDSAKSQNIEMTAYVLRAILLVKNFPDVELAGSKIARWIASQRNPRGGFSSTQDTVMALTALAEFSELGNSGGAANLDVGVSVEDGESWALRLTGENRFIVQRHSFDDFPAEVTISASGVGCMLYSVSADYYIKREKETLDPFTLGVTSRKNADRFRRDADSSSSEEEEESCEKVAITISARYNGEDGASNMAIINFRPVSGYVFDKDSLESLTSSYSFLQRYEVKEDVATFYFDEITTEDIRFTVHLTREFEVEDAKPALITVLDYYENNLRVSEEFNFTCAAPQSLGVAPYPETTTYTTPVSPTGYRSSTPTEEPDYDECLLPDVCGGPEWTCENYPGTYECICSEGYQLDESESNCVAIPSCPICADGIPADVKDRICLYDLIQTMKVRMDGNVWPRMDVVSNKNIEDRYYYEVVMDDQCVCDTFVLGARIIVVADRDNLGAATDRWEKLTLDETTMVVPGTPANKRDIQKIREEC